MRALLHNADPLRSGVAQTVGRLAFSPDSPARHGGAPYLDLRYADRPLLQEAIRVLGAPRCSGIIFGRASPPTFYRGARGCPITLDEQTRGVPDREHPGCRPPWRLSSRPAPWAGWS